MKAWERSQERAVAAALAVFFLESAQANAELWYTGHTVAILALPI